MNLSALGQRALGTSKLYFKKNGPAILTGAGVLGFVGTTVLVARAAVKAKPEIDDIKHDLNVVEGRILDASYTRHDQVKDYGTIVVNAVKDIGKIYAPAIVLGGISVTCVISAHGMLKKQNAALVAAYGALDLGFKAYRQRVKDTLGMLGVDDPEARERDIYRGVVSRTKVENPETGEACEIENFSDVIPSIYGRFFDDASPQWSKTPEFNLTFLMNQQSFANDLLTRRGHLFLNEVYDALGFERSQAGQVVGWLKNSKNGDGYVDFGIHDIASDISRAFVNGQERVIFLDFNVDGPIINGILQTIRERS